jgi:ribosomal protein L7/L12
VRDRNENPDAVAIRCLRDGLNPIDAVKAVRATGLALREAKEVVHRNLPRDRQQAAELVWDAAEEGLRAED